MCCISGNDNNSTASTSNSSNSNSSNSTRNKELLPEEFEPNDYSVICGRGKVYSNSPGNIRLQNIVSLYVSAYSQATTKCQKSEIVSLILHRAKQQQGVGPHSENLFVKYEQHRWWVVSDNVAREKIGGLLRERLSSQYKSSSKAKMIAKKRQSIKAIETALRGYDSSTVSTTIFFDQHQEQDLMNTKTPTSSSYERGMGSFGQDFFPQDAVSGSGYQRYLSPKMIDDPTDTPFIMDRIRCDVISSGNVEEESPLVGLQEWSTNPHLQQQQQHRHGKVYQQQHSTPSKLPLTFTSFQQDDHQDDNGPWLFFDGNNGSGLTSHHHQNFLECRRSGSISSISNCSPSSSSTEEERGTTNSNNGKLLFEQLEKACDKIAEALLLERKRQGSKTGSTSLHSFFNDNNLVAMPTCTGTTSVASSSSSSFPSCPTVTAVATPDADIDLMMIPSNFDPTTIFG